MATQVNTVIGPLPIEDLGFTLMHEHLWFQVPGHHLDSMWVDNTQEAVDTGVSSLEAARALGVSAMVDPQPMELGRDVELMRRVSEGSGVPIICAVGLYTEQHPQMPGIPPYYKVAPAEFIAERYIHELVHGVGDTGIVPGIIKAATGPGNITEAEEKCLRAAAMASKATGIPITTHTTEGTMGPEQLDIFESEGVELRNVIVGHSDDATDLNYFARMFERGAYVGIDKVGGAFGQVTDETRIGLLKAFIALGYERQVVLSHDHVNCLPDIAKHVFGDRVDAIRNRDFTILPGKFVPMMREAGISQESIDNFTTHNPRRFFSGE